MVFFNVLNAICHMGDVDTLSKLGVSLIKKAEKSNFSATVLIGIVGYFVFDVVSTDGSVSVGVFGDIYKMLLKYLFLINSRASQLPMKPVAPVTMAVFLL